MLILNGKSLAIRIEGIQLQITYVLDLLTKELNLGIIFFPFKKCFCWDDWVAPLVKHLPSAQVMISGSWDRGPRWAPCSVGSLLLPLLLLLPLVVLSLFFALSNQSISQSINLQKKFLSMTSVIECSPLLSTSCLLLNSLEYSVCKQCDWREVGTTPVL